MHRTQQENSQAALRRSRGLRFFSLRWMLFGSFTLMLALTLSVGLLAITTQRQAVNTLDRMLSVDIRSADLTLNAAMAMMRARRYEKDFFLSQKEFGFDEAKSRYVTLFRTTLRDAYALLDQIQELSTDQQVAKDLEQVKAAMKTYEGNLLEVVELDARLGYIDTGLEGAFRDKAHRIEAMLVGMPSTTLQRDLLFIRRYEKDYIQRGRDIDSGLLEKAFALFKTNLALERLDSSRKERLGRLADEYLALFKEYVQTNVLVDDKKRKYLDALQSIEPGLAKLVIRARNESETTRVAISDAERGSEQLITTITAMAFLIGIVGAWFVYRRITRSVDKTMQFAMRIAADDLATRIDTTSRDEFGTLDRALNQMADALSESCAAQERKTAELRERNTELSNEMLARISAERLLIEANAELESRVAERTQELRGANEQLHGDIEERKKTEYALAESEKRFRSMADLSSDWYWEQDEHFRFTLMSRDDQSNNGMVLSQYIGKTRRELPIMLHEPEWAAHEAVLATRHTFTDFEYRVEFPNSTLRWFSITGEPMFDLIGAFTGYRGIGKDITERKQSEENIRHMAFHDALTGLPNRPLLQDRLNQAIAHAGRFGHSLWVLFVDLDRFKFINDSLGHEAGDTLLRTIGARLQSLLRTHDTVARLGGDEFVIVLPGIPEGCLDSVIFQRILDAVAEPTILNGQEIVISCSIGAATYPGDGTIGESLVECADVAMYRAKRSGRNNFQFYHPKMNEGVSERLGIEAGLRRALRNSEFVLHYQPQVHLRSGEIVGMEALIRWQHPELGLIPPGRFISIAEETGIIVPIGMWVLKTACAQNKAWQMQGHPHIRVAVNLSARQFSAPDLVQTIIDVLQETGLAPDCLDVEITESLIMTDVERAVSVLHKLKEHGVQLSIDDFGTGYSSLMYLKRFPIDILKIDKSFVQDIMVDKTDAAIAASVISLAHNLGIHVIAEGVETQGQIDFLRLHGCDQMQGFYFSPPVEATVFEKMLHAGKRLIDNQKSI